jgi:hypothetical protein
MGKALGLVQPNDVSALASGSLAFGGPMRIIATHSSGKEAESIVRVKSCVPQEAESG